MKDNEFFRYTMKGRDTMSIAKQLITKLNRQNAAATSTSEAIAELEAMKSKDLRILSLIEDLRSKLTGQLKLVQATQDQVTAVTSPGQAPSTKDRQHKN